MNNFNQERTEKRWETNLDKWEKSGLLDNITDPHIKRVTSLMLENQELIDNVSTDITLNVDKSLELVSKIVHNLLAHKIVSVQPKLGPCSTVYFPKLMGDSFVVDNEDMICNTRKLKSYEHPVIDVDSLANKIIEEINNEILTDLYNNVGTIGTVKELSTDSNSLYYKIIEMSGVIHRKTLKKRNYWLVVSPSTFDRFSKDFDNFKYSNYTIHVINSFRNDCVLMGQQCDNWYDSAYIYAPYIMLRKTPGIDTFRPGFIVRYGKKLVRGGQKSFAKIMLPAENFNIKVIAK